MIEVEYWMYHKDVMNSYIWEMNETKKIMKRHMKLLDKNHTVDFVVGPDEYRKLDRFIHDWQQSEYEYVFWKWSKKRNRSFWAHEEKNNPFRKSKKSTYESCVYFNILVLSMRNTTIHYIQPCKKGNNKNLVVEPIRNFKCTISKSRNKNQWLRDQIIYWKQRWMHECYLQLTQYILSAYF